MAAKKALNKKVLSQAQALASSLHVELEIIIAIEVPALLSDLDLVDPGQLRRQIVERRLERRRLVQAGDLDNQFHGSSSPGGASG